MMQRQKIVNFFFDKGERGLRIPQLYVRAQAPFLFNEAEDAWALRAHALYDFTTYFNACSIQKWRRYTAVETVSLHLEIKGGAAELFATSCDALATTVDIQEEPLLKIGASADWQSVEVQIPAADTSVLIGVALKTQDDCLIRNLYFFTEVEESQLREVELALATTTFKKEDYILPNIEKIKTEILSQDDELAHHFNLHVVDNGRTLDAESLTEGRVHVYPNDNVGGSGGFARGMIAALEQEPQATHVLLMDDDVSVSTESIRRTFALLRLLKPEYDNAFISGAMLNMDIPEDQWEDTGFMTPEGRFAGCKPALRMTMVADLVFNETFEPTEFQSKQMYAAWWYCCIPVATIKEKGLPLPIFVRCDDAEYGIRCKPQFISMNGIGIWHAPFHSRYNAAVERYQTTRNTLIAQSCFDFAPESDFLKEIHHNIQLELKKFNYTNAELVLDAFEDYMKGPDFIMKPVAEECFMRSNRAAEKLVPFSELQAQIDEDTEIELNLSDLTVASIYQDFPRTRKEALHDLITGNNQATILAGKSSGVAVIDAAGWTYQPGSIRNKRTIIAVDRWNKKGVIRRQDRARYKEIYERYKQDLKQYRKIQKELKESYRAHAAEMTSPEFWKNYLGM